MLRNSSLLLDERPLVIMPKLACIIGLNEAIVLQQVHYMLQNNKLGKKVNGRRWIYNSYQKWQEVFPFLSERTIQRVFLHLEKEGLLLAGQYNAMASDRTKWYSVDYDALENLNSKYEKAEIEAETEDTIVPNWHVASRQNGTMDDAKMAHSYLRLQPKTTIPKTTTTEATSKNLIDSEKPELVKSSSSNSKAENKANQSISGQQERSIKNWYAEQSADVSRIGATKAFQLASEYSFEWFQQAYTKAILAGRSKTDLNYVEGILKNCKREGHPPNQSKGRGAAAVSAQNLEQSDKLAAAKARQEQMRREAGL